MKFHYNPLELNIIHFIFRAKFQYFCINCNFCEKFAELIPCILLKGMSQRHPLAPLPPPQLLSTLPIYPTPLAEGGRRGA